jgi:hypothetical protein
MWVLLLAAAPSGVRRVPVDPSIAIQREDNKEKRRRRTRQNTKTPREDQEEIQLGHPLSAPTFVSLCLRGYF